MCRAASGQKKGVKVGQEGALTELPSGWFNGRLSVDNIVCCSSILHKLFWIYFGLPVPRFLSFLPLPPSTPLPCPSAFLYLCISVCSILFCATKKGSRSSRNQFQAFIQDATERKRWLKGVCVGGLGWGWLACPWLFCIVTTAASQPNPPSKRPHIPRTTLKYASNLLWYPFNLLPPPSSTPCLVGDEWNNKLLLFLPT